MLKNLQKINTRETTENKESSSTIGGTVSWYNHYGEQCEGFFKKLHLEIPHDSAILLWAYPRENYNLKKYMHPNVHCSIICNSQDMETT